MCKALSTIILIIILAQGAAAFTTTSTNTAGTSPAAYGPRIAFLTFEDSIDQDLNNDGDFSDHVLQYYDSREKKTINTVQEAVRFALADGTAIIEDKTRRLWKYDFEKSAAEELGERGTTPRASGTKIVFATAEQDVDTDLNEDGDKLDDIIRYHDLSPGKTTNTRASGTTPAISGDTIIFSTNEDDVNEDLNKDNDLDDNIIRTVYTETDQVKNTRVTGKNPVGISNNVAVIADSKQLWTLNLDTGAKLNTNIPEDDAMLDNGVLAYERDGTIKLYRISTGIEKDTGIRGTQPFLYNDLLAFAAEDKTITFVQGEDDDKDSIPDFADNCQEYANTDQADRDRDGIGDTCDANDDTTAIPKAEEPPAEEPPAANAQITAKAADQAPAQETTPAERKPLIEAEQEQPRKKQNTAYWFLLAVGLGMAGILLYFAPKWLEKRRKGFGF